MLILGIETSTKTGSVALYDNESGIIAETILQVKFNHSDTLMESINNLFQISTVSKKDIDKIAVGIGPGSFTGIRIGIGTAKGLAYSLNIPVIGINSLDILGNNISDTSRKIIPLIDARHKRAYYSVYEYKGDKIEKIKDYNVESLEEIFKKYNQENLIFTGRGSIVYRDYIKNQFGEDVKFTKKANSFLRASILAELAVDKKDDNLHKLEPFYLSKSQAQKQKEKSDKK
ncbi:MAG: tRNA (adenosine(37)-N6)-threonylcarbamoyltransferase complex dimerization subunit type 1 TsaB [Fusobacteriota bacterium]